MTTVNVNSVLVQKPYQMGINSSGYGLNKIILPNIATQAPGNVSSLSITDAGSGYTGIPTIGFTGGGGSGAAASASMEALTASVVTPQSGSGSYAPGDTVTTTGGTGTEPILTVSTTQVVSATIAAAGTGGTSGTQTVTGTTGTGTKFQASVTVSGGGITAILSITVAGSYTANPSVLTAEPVTGASLSGAELSIKMGYLTGTVSTAGSLSVLATNPVAQGSTSGSGTGATFNLTYGVASAAVSNAGDDYTSAPTVTFTGGGGSGAAATANLATENDPVIMNLAFNTPLPVSTYNASVIANQACVTAVSNKTANGLTVTLTPLNNDTLSTGTMDVVIDFPF